MVELEKQDYHKNKELYKKIETLLRKDIDEKIPINHVGSTAIPNMYGKNIIDILIGVEKTEFDKIRNILIKNNFYPSSSEDIYQFFSSRKEETKSGDIHIHLVVKNTDRYNEFLILKNYLLNNKQEALEYSNFKKQLLKEGINNRKEYKKRKSEYVTLLLERALKYNNKL